MRSAWYDWGGHVASAWFVWILDHKGIKIVTNHVGHRREGLDDEQARAEVGRLFERHGRRLYSVARRLCGNPTDAEDLVQEAFLAAYRSWNQFQGRSTPETWLYTIARRGCQRMHRRRAGEPARLESLSELLPQPSPTVPDVEQRDGPQGELLRAEARAIVEAGLARLPLPFRLPLVLADVAELTPSEIAHVLGLKEATVKTRLHRARLKLRRVLADGLPQRAAAEPNHARSLCLDLLRAKLEAFDRGVPFPHSDAALCGRCRAVFDTLDLSRDACAVVTDLPAGLRARLGWQDTERSRRT